MKFGILGVWLTETPKIDNKLKPMFVVLTPQKRVDFDGPEKK